MASVNGKVNLTNDTAADVIPAAGAGVRIAVLGISASNAHGTQATKLEIRDGTTVKLIRFLDAKKDFTVSGRGVLFYSTAGAAVTARCVTSGADVDVFIWAYLDDGHWEAFSV